MSRDLIKESFESGSAPDKQLQQGMLAAGLPPEPAGLITKMGQGVRQGLINRDFLQRAPQVTGSITLPDFKAAFKAAYVH